MSLILSGSDGLSDVDGSAATPAIRGTDANTGIFFPAADTIAFSEGGAEVMRIDSDGDVGIGTTTPNSKLTSQTASTSNSVFSFANQLNNSYASNDSISALGFHVRADVNATGVGGAIAFSGGGTSDGSGNLIFCIKPTGNIATVVAPSNEKMRITPNGTVILQGGSTSATGVGIAFPATQSASSDANTLDDYEEGTFTPTITGTSPAGTASYSVQIGKYTKIGDRVLINIYLQWSSGTGGGAMNISGLPFSADGQSPLTNYNGSVAMAAGHVMQILTASTLININSVPSGGGSDANVTYDTTGLLIVGGSYKI